METFHILHLAASWHGTDDTSEPHPPPLATSAVLPDISHTASTQKLASDLPPTTDKSSVARPTIKAAAAQMVFASRSSQDFITPEMVLELENWTGQAVLEALRGFEIASNVNKIPVHLNCLLMALRHTTEFTQRSW